MKQNIHSRSSLKKTSQHGLSLVEIMVALVISVFLLGGVIQVYLSNKVSYGFTESISRIQESGRFAMDIMSQDLRQANFYGCTTLDPDDTSNFINHLNPAGEDYQPELFDFIAQEAVEGTDNDGLNGSDSITVRGSKPSQSYIQQPYANTLSDPIFISKTNSLEADDIVMISNCKRAEIFQIASLGPGANVNQNTLTHTTDANSPGNINNDVAKPCLAGGTAHCLSIGYSSVASVFELQTVTYTIAATGDAGSVEPALWRSVNGTDEELVNGVEQMQVLYGVDLDGDLIPNQYFTADNVADSTQIVSLRITLLLRSDDLIAESSQQYRFNGVDITAPDLRLRQVFTTTIALRNRIGAS